MNRLHGEGGGYVNDKDEEGQDNQMLPRVVGKRLAQSRLPTRHSPSEKFL